MACRSIVDPGETLRDRRRVRIRQSVTALSVLRLIPNPPGRIESGEILFDGVDLVEARRSRHPRGARQQDRDDLPGADVLAQSGADRRPAGSGADQRASRHAHGRKPIEAATELIGRVRIADAASRLGSYPHQYSGGMRQRVMIAMALACAPRLIIADEPTTALDVTVQAQILDLLKELTRETGSSLILITHDLGVVARYADRVAVMYGGRIVEVAPARELYARPQHPYTSGLMASVPRLDGAGGRRLMPIEGQPPDLASLPPGCSFAPRCRVDPRTMPNLAAGTGSRLRDRHAKACFRPCLNALPTTVTADEPILRVEDLKVHFPVTKGIIIQRQVATVKAVDGVSFTIRRGETLGLVGESGSGKSTTGLAVLRMLTPTAGRDRVRRSGHRPASRR